MQNEAVRDMTTGSPAKHIFFFSIPLLLGNVLQQLYNMVDSWTVGNFTGDTALAAVGIGFPVIFLFVSLFIGLSIGSTVVIAQFYGAGEPERVRAAVDTAYAAFLIAAIPISLLGFALTGPILHLMQVDAAAFPEAQLYLRLVSLGLVGSIGYNTNAGILQGLGDSKTPLIFLTIATVINIVLDVLFVAVFHWGVAGVAFATIIAEWFSWIFGMFYINRKYTAFRLHLRGLKIDRRLLYQIIRIGLPAGIQNGLIAASIMALMAKVNTYEYDFTAGFNVGNKIDCFAFLPVQSFGNAVTTFVGQNVGAGRMDRVRTGTRVTLLMSILWCVAAAAVIMPLSRPIMLLFSQTEAVVEAGVLYLWWVMPFYPLFATLFVLNFAMRGAGDALFPLVNSIISVVVVRVILCYILADAFGQQYMFGCYAGGWLVGAVLSVGYYLSGRWKRFGSIADAEAAQEKPSETQ